MKTRHVILYVLWGIIANCAFPFYRKRYEIDRNRAWEMNHTALAFREWLHRNWFPGKYAYERHLEDNDG